VLIVLDYIMSGGADVRRVTHGHSAGPGT